MRDLSLSLGLTFLLVTGAQAQTPRRGGATERNVALASFGTTVRADSEWMNSPFAAGGERATYLIDGVRNEISSPPQFNRWHSAPASPHPHWIWLHFPRRCVIRRAVLWRTSLTDYPLELKIQYLSDDRSRLIEIIHVWEAAFPPGGMDLNVDFPPIVTDNLRLVILRSSNKESPDYAQLSELEVIGKPLLGPASSPPGIEPWNSPAGLEVEKESERNVALRSYGTTVRADSEWTNSPFVAGGEGASHLIDGVRNEVSSPPHFNRWHSAPASPHPHWIWLRFPVPCTIRRVVLWRTTLADYPVEFKISYLNADRSSLIDLVHVREAEFPAGRLDLAVDFPRVVTDNLRLVILRSSNKEFPNYAQLSELEVIGNPAESEIGKPAPFSGPAQNESPVPPPRTESGPLPIGLSVRDEPDQVTFESRSQWLALSKHVPRILDWQVDGFGEGRFRKDILKPPGVAPCLVGRARKVCRPPPSVSYSRKGNVVTYGEFASSPLSRMQWSITVLPDGFTLTSTETRTREMLALDATDAPRVRFDFDGLATPTSPLGRLEAPGTLRFPVFLTVPDFGAYLVSARASHETVFWRFSADPSQRRVGLDVVQTAKPNADGVIVLPATQVITLDLRLAEAYPLAQYLKGQERFRGLRRAWTNIFQFRPDIGILSNNVISQNCIFCLYEYADAALYTPDLPGGLSAMDLVRSSLDAYLDGAEGYGQPAQGFLDSEPSLLIAAWDYYLATGDRVWLTRRVPDLERIACEVLSRKERGGLLGSFLSGNSYSFRWGSNWWDIISFGHKDAYANALTYRALLGLADLERELARDDKAVEFSEAARAIREDFVATFYNPKTGVLAGWKSADGELHDYYFTFIAGIAVAYGLVPDDIANVIIDRMQARFREVGYHSFQYGLPGNLAPIAKKDYVPGRAGAPQLDDGSDAFQQYENGGATGCFAYFYIQALYKLGRREEADRILFPMLESFDRGSFQDGVGSGVDWKTWDGKACGYEGMLVDNYYALLAVLTGYFGIEHDMSGVRLRPDSPLVGKEVDWTVRHLGRAIRLTSRRTPE